MFLQRVALTEDLDYHVALYIDGFVHCAWFEQVLPPEEYAKRMFPDHDDECDGIISG